MHSAVLLRAWLRVCEVVVVILVPMVLWVDVSRDWLIVMTSVPMMMMITMLFMMMLLRSIMKTSQQASHKHADPKA